MCFHIIGVVFEFGDWDDGIIVVMFKDGAGTEMVTAS